MGAVPSPAGRPAGRLERIDPAFITQDQLAGLLREALGRLEQAGPWDGPAPFHSAHSEAVEGRPGRSSTQEMDAFAKRREMMAEADKLGALIDGARRVDFTPDMRRDLTAIRDIRDGLRNEPARDLDGALSRLAEKCTNDQLRIMQMRDKPAASATEALQRRRTTERIASRNLQSIDDARRLIQAQPGIPSMQRISMAAKLKPLEKAMGQFAGKTVGK